MCQQPGMGSPSCPCSGKLKRVRRAETYYSSAGSSLKYWQKIPMYKTKDRAVNKTKPSKGEYKKGQTHCLHLVLDCWGYDRVWEKQTKETQVVDKKIAAVDSIQKWERKQRYCTTGQGASGPEGGRGGAGGEESPDSPDRLLVSSQPCQWEPVKYSEFERKLREKQGTESRRWGNTEHVKGLGERKVGVS